jgi:hypothetical protein
VEELSERERIKSERKKACESLPQEYFKGVEKFPGERVLFEPQEYKEGDLIR